jgi:hypothetical protein
MNPEVELRVKLSRIYLILSGDLTTPERVEAASEKLSEAIGLLAGTIPVPKGEESHG